MSALRAACLLVLLSFVQPALAASWERYVDDDLGFSISVPDDQFKVDSRSEGRLRLSEIDGVAQLDIFGVRNPEALSVAEFRRMMEAADPSRRITYRAAGNSWFVLSGYLEAESEPTIFYAKFMLNRDRTALSAFEISYPEAQKRRFDATVERIEDSLTSPR